MSIDSLGTWRFSSPMCSLIGRLSLSRLYWLLGNLSRPWRGVAHQLHIDGASLTFQLACRNSLAPQLSLSLSLSGAPARLPSLSGPSAHLQRFKVSMAISLPTVFLWRSGLSTETPWPFSSSTEPPRPSSSPIEPLRPLKTPTDAPACLCSLSDSLGRHRVSLALQLGYKVSLVL